MRKIKFKRSLDVLLYVIAFLMVVGIGYAAVTDLDGIRLKATGDETYQVEVQNSSGTRKFSVDSSGNSYVAGTLTATGAVLTSPTVTGLDAAFPVSSHVYTTNNDWVLSATEAKSFLLTVTSGTAAVNIVDTYNTSGRIHAVRCDTTVAGGVTLKRSGGTGVAIASGKTAILIDNGTDYIRLTADATH